MLCVPAGHSMAISWGVITNLRVNPYDTLFLTTVMGRGGFFMGTLLPCGRRGGRLVLTTMLIQKQYLSIGHRWLDGKVEILHVPVNESSTSYHKISLLLSSNFQG